jgi:hypothetical protein
MLGTGKVENNVIHTHLETILGALVSACQGAFTLKLDDAFSYPTPKDLRRDPERTSQAVYPSRFLPCHKTQFLQQKPFRESLLRRANNRFWSLSASNIKRKPRDVKLIYQE